jgi:hypothetical protein
MREPEMPGPTQPSRARQSSSGFRPEGKMIARSKLGARSLPPLKGEKFWLLPSLSFPAPALPLSPGSAPLACGRLSDASLRPHSLGAHPSIARSLPVLRPFSVSAFQSL